MPRLSPLIALRFTSRAGDPACLLAPPYDVIDEAMGEELRTRSPHNCVRLILPQGSAQTRYEHAAQLLTSWRREGVLAPDREPGLYAYRQTWADGGESRTRHALFAELVLSPFGEGEVLPHERTHAGPKEDRLRLTLATRAQLSPVLLLARDPVRALLHGLRAAASGTPLLRTETPDGVGHDLWRIVGDAPCRDLCQVAGAHPLLVADGHHRYETALEVARRLPEVPSAASLLACVVSDADPGLLVRPTHRVIRAPATMEPGAGLPRPIQQAFDAQSLGDIEPEAGARAAERRGGGALVLHRRGLRGTPAAAWLIEARPTALAEAGLSEEAARTASVIFDRVVLPPLTGLDTDAAAAKGSLLFFRAPQDAFGAAGAGGATFYLPPVALPDVWGTAARGERLPPKSTYFEPKIPSGILFRPL